MVKSVSIPDMHVCVFWFTVVFTRNDPVGIPSRR